MDTDTYPTIIDSWSPDARAPQIVDAALVGLYDNGLEIWKLGIHRISIGREDLQQPK